MGAHSSVVGGSTAGLRLICNASIEESQKHPNTTSLAAVNGTVLHTICERAIAEGMEDNEVLHTFIGMKYADLLHEDEEIEEFGHLRVTEEIIRAKALPALALFDEIVPENAEVLIEQKMSSGIVYDDSPFNHDACTLKKPDLWSIAQGKGTGDKLFHTASRAGLIDYKFGDGHMVDPFDDKDGAQFFFYLVLAIHNNLLPWVDEYEVHVIQPAARLAPSEYHKKRIVKFDELYDFAWDLKDAVEGERRYVAGDHCRFCKGKTTCPALKATLALAQDTDVKGMSNKDLAKMLNMLPVLEAFVQDVKATALRNAQNNVEIPGWKLEAGLGVRRYKDETAAWKALGRLGLSADERTVKKTISAPQALTLLAKKGTDKRQIDGFERRHVDRPETAQKLVKCAPGEPSATGLQQLSKALQST